MNEWKIDARPIIEHPLKMERVAIPASYFPYLPTTH